jgi:signal transduction histidine kinase/CheY-like chemotaxis protein
MHARSIDRLLLPAIFGLTTIVIAVNLWLRLVTHQRVAIQADAAEQAWFVKTNIEAELRARVLPLQRLAGRWQNQGLTDEKQMESDAGLVMSGYPAYQAIEWVAPTFRVLWVAPERGNEANIGADLGAVPEVRATLEEADHNNSTMVAAGGDLRQSGRGFLVCVPVHSGGKLSGFLVAVFHHQELLSTILQDVAPGYWVAIYDGNKEVYGRMPADPPRDGRYVREADIEFQQLTWRAFVWPKAGAVAYARSSLPTLVLSCGILLALTLAFAVYMAETAKLNVQKLEAANRELEREIAGREQAEEALRQAQKMEAIGRLAGGVAHDFNNLLMVIRGQAALTQNSVAPNSSLCRELGEIVKAADRASSLTRKLLAFGRKQVLQPRVLDLNVLVTQIAEILPSVLGEDIKVSMELEPELGRVKADSAQLEQVIMNLVFNARDAMPHGGDLTIETANRDLDEAWIQSHPGVQAGPHVTLVVRDTGHGMDDETQSHAFEPFFTTKDIDKGSGLGLATVYGIVHQSGGYITVSSKLGLGTVIQIYLPRVEEPVEVVEAPKPIVQSLQGKERILVVEDDDAVRRMTLEFLKIRGYEVIEARSAADAIEWVKSHDEAIDLVLTDVVMPGMKGRELTERLAQLRAGTKVLYMSAHAEDDAINIGILSPGTAFIEKPFSPDQLAAKVRDVLSRTSSSSDDQPLRHGAQA